MRRSATRVKHGCVVSSTLVTPTGRCAPPGTPPKQSEASTGFDSLVLALRYTLQLADDLGDGSCPLEINKLGRTVSRWSAQIINWHLSRVTNGPAEALNNLIKRVKRAAFGLPNFGNYRMRALLYAGKPNWDLLTSVAPH